MRRAVLLIVSLLAAASPAAATTQVAYVYAPDDLALAVIASYPVSLEEPDFPDWARIAASPEAVDQLRRAGFAVEVAIDDLAAWAGDRLRPPDPRDALPPGAKVDLDHYFTHEEAAAFLADLQAAHPDIMSVETIGQSVLGRELWLVKISDNVAVNEPEPAVIFDHCIHGDELSGCALGFFIIQWLTDGYGVDDQITALVNEREVFIVPVVNPDGNQPDALSRYNANGVDLNRDFGYLWIETYDQTEPQAQPEARALSDVWRGQPFSFGTSAHAGATYFIYPWAFDYDDAPESPELDHLGQQYCWPNHATDPQMAPWGQAPNLLGGPTADTAMDEMLGCDGFLGTGLELSACKECPWWISAVTAAANRPAVLWVIEEMGRGLHGQVTDGDGTPLEAMLKVGERWPAFTDPDVGDFHKYLRPADYPVRFTANGYEELNVIAHVVDEALLQLDVELTPAVRPTTFALRMINSSLYEWMPANPPFGYYVLGRPDGRYLPLGLGGFATLDLGREGVADGPGADLAVYEGQDLAGDEPFELWGGDQPHGPWTLIGAGVGTAEFDLADAGLAAVRYVRVQDAYSPAAAHGKTPAAATGYDLDAVGSPGPLANFNAAPRFVAPLAAVQFTDASRGEPTSWLWDFGDGETSAQQNPSHAYTELGFYPVSLTIDGLHGADSIVKHDFMGVLDAPVADFDAAPRNVFVGEAVQFTDLTQGHVAQYAWDFGDNYIGTEKNPTHAYLKAGDFSVTLTATGLVGDDQAVKYNFIHVGVADDDDDDDDDDNDDNDDDDNDDDTTDDDDDNDDNDNDADDDDDDDDDGDDQAGGEGDDDDSGCGC